MSTLSRRAVLETAHVHTGSNVFQLDASAAERALLKDPWVAEASITRDLPGTVRIAVTERLPVGTTEDGSVVASDGVALPGVGPALGQCPRYRRHRTRSRRQRVRSVRSRLPRFPRWFRPLRSGRRDGTHPSWWDGRDLRIVGIRGGEGRGPGLVARLARSARGPGDPDRPSKPDRPDRDPRRGSSRRRRSRDADGVAGNDRRRRVTSKNNTARSRQRKRLTHLAPASSVSPST